VITPGEKKDLQSHGLKPNERQESAKRKDEPQVRNETLHGGGGEQVGWRILELQSVGG